MHKFLTTDDFFYKGQSTPGIPMFVDKKDTQHSVLNNFMLHFVFDQGGIESIHTLNGYADALLDYFNWLNTNSLFWDDKPCFTKTGREISNFALYQRWSEKDYRKPNGQPLSPATINLRSSRIQHFYLWAKTIAELIDWLPYMSILKPKPQHHPDAFAHMHSKQYVEGSSLKLKVPKKLPKLLSINECRELLATPMSKTLKGKTRQMLSTGIRNVECRTFPCKYVIDPRQRAKNHLRYAEQIIHELGDEIDPYPIPQMPSKQRKDQGIGNT